MNKTAETAYETWSKSTPHRKDDRYHAFMAGWTAALEEAYEKLKEEHLRYIAGGLPDLPMRAMQK